MKTYIIGSNGFLGSHLSEWFDKHGEVRKAPAYDSAATSRWQETVMEDLRSFKPNIVFIAGACQNMLDDAVALHSLLMSNCELPCLVAQNLLMNAPLAKLVVFGTSWQYADSDSYRPFNLYAASKQAGQDLLVHYSLCGLKILQLIMFDTYGEDDSRNKLLKMLQDALAQDIEISTTTGEQEIDLVHIDDVCAGIEAAVLELDFWDSSAGVMIRGLGSGKPILVKELICSVSTQFEKPLRVRVGARDYRPREVMKVFRKYKRPLGWLPVRKEFQAKTKK